MRTYKKVLILAFITVTFNLSAQHKIELINSFDSGSIVESSKSLADAKQIFTIIKNAPIATRTKKEKANNCENRAEFAFKVLKSKGFEPINFWIFKEGLVETKYTNSKDVKTSKGFSFNTKIGRNPFVFWGYHVASGIIINENGKTDTLIFDPWTQEELVSLDVWALSFFNDRFDKNIIRTSYVFPVLNLYKFYGTTAIGQLSTNKKEWDKNLDNDMKQMYCGLCGITPNSKCYKRKNQKKINSKKEELNNYLKKLNINITE